MFSMRMVYVRELACVAVIKVSLTLIFSIFINLHFVSTMCDEYTVVCKRFLMWFGAVV